MLDTVDAGVPNIETSGYIGSLRDSEDPTIRFIGGYLLVKYMVWAGGGEMVTTSGEKESCQDASALAEKVVERQKDVASNMKYYEQINSQKADPGDKLAGFIIDGILRENEGLGQLAVRFRNLGVQLLDDVIETYAEAIVEANLFATKNSSTDMLVIPAVNGSNRVGRIRLDVMGTVPNSGLESGRLVRSVLGTDTATLHQNETEARDQAIANSEIRGLNQLVRVLVACGEMVKPIEALVTETVDKMVTHFGVPVVIPPTLNDRIMFVLTTVICPVDHSTWRDPEKYFTPTEATTSSVTPTKVQVLYQLWRFLIEETSKLTTDDRDCIWDEFVTGGKGAVARQQLGKLVVKREILTGQLQDANRMVERTKAEMPVDLWLGDGV